MGGEKRGLKIQINSKLRITADSHNFRLERLTIPKPNNKKPRRGRKPEDPKKKILPYWRVIGYWASLVGPLTAARDEIIKDVGPSTLEDVLKNLKDLRALFEDVSNQCLDFWKAQPPTNEPE